MKELEQAVEALTNLRVQALKANNDTLEKSLYDIELMIFKAQDSQSNGKTKEEVWEGFVELLKSLSINGGRVVCTNQLTPHDINDARDSGRMWVDEWGVGYVWMPEPFWPTTPEKVELFEKYYPNPIEVPKELSSENILNWIKNKEQEKKDNLQSHANKDGGVTKEDFVNELDKHFKNRPDLNKEFDRIDSLIASIRTCTRPIRGHNDPKSINDCFDELEYYSKLLRSRTTLPTNQQPEANKDGWVSKTEGEKYKIRIDKKDFYVNTRFINGKQIKILAGITEGMERLASNTYGRDNEEMGWFAYRLVKSHHSDEKIKDNEEIDLLEEKGREYFTACTGTIG